MNFVGRTAIITGSSRGIGRSIAEKLAQLGAFVVINGRNNETVDEVVSIIRESGGKACGVVGSVANKQTADLLVNSALDHTGRIDLLVNNAGTIADRLSYKMTLEEFNEVIDIHVKGTFLCTKAAVNIMRHQEEGGMIINMTSLAGMEGTVGQLNYSAAKAALNGMTWTLAKELKKYNIQVNGVSPAAVTDMTRPYIEKAKQHGGTLSDYWKIGTVDDVSNFIAKLVAYRNLERSGEIYAVNGSKIGRYLKPKYEEIQDIEEFLL
ncbi:SDR family NAD(P)-dependent oxidoreductase [Calidifontibacillus erzurumensis]|uniref:SDR family NAD(P)-dependent oxidoreductase n=1 Tax=Calidifontibacillus erzurumensis TaxID=2741433 RepID=UPI0035B55A27